MYIYVQTFILDVINWCDSTIIIIYSISILFQSTEKRKDTFEMDNINVH